MSVSVIPCTVPSWAVIDGDIAPVIAWKIDPHPDADPPVIPITRHGLEPSAAVVHDEYRAEILASEQNAARHPRTAR